MNVRGLTPAALASAAARLNPFHLTDRIVVVMVTDDTAHGVLSLPILDATRAVIPSVREASNLVNDHAPGHLVGFLFGLDPTAPRNVCNLWFDLLACLTDLPLHGPVTVYDGLAACSCGCSTAAAAQPRALATAGA